MAIPTLNVISQSGRIFSVEIQKIRDNKFSLKIDGKAVNGKYEFNNNVIDLEMNSRISEKTIISEFPGIISDIYVKKGDKVTTGTKLLSIIAMKMENIIFPQKSGKVKKIFVKKDQQIDAKQKLIELE